MNPVDQLRQMDFSNKEKGSLLGTVFFGLVSLHTGSPGFFMGSATVSVALLSRGDDKGKEVDES